MADDFSGEESLDDFLRPFEVTGVEEFYRMERGDLSYHFDLVDEYLSVLGSPARVELAEAGFQNYHSRGFLEPEDDVVVYASSGDEGLERGSVALDERTTVRLGRSHEELGEEPVPVQFTDVKEYPFENYRFFMPSHEAVDSSLDYDWDE